MKNTLGSQPHKLEASFLWLKKRNSTSQSHPLSLVFFLIFQLAEILLTFFSNSNSSPPDQIFVLLPLLYLYITNSSTLSKKKMISGYSNTRFSSFLYITFGTSETWSEHCRICWTFETRVFRSALKIRSHHTCGDELLCGISRLF